MVVFATGDPSVGEIDEVLHLGGLVRGKFLVGEGGELMEAELEAGQGEGLVGVGVGRLLGEGLFGGRDGGDGVGLDGLGDLTGREGAGQAVKKTLLRAEHRLLGLAQAATHFDAARITGQDAGQNFDGILGVCLQLLVRGRDLFLEPGIELGKGDFFHG